MDVITFPCWVVFTHHPLPPYNFQAGGGGGGVSRSADRAFIIYDMFCIYRYRLLYH